MTAMTPRRPDCTARDPLELAQLLERVDADVRVRADADADPALEIARRPERSRRRGSPRSSGTAQTRAPASASRSSSCRPRASRGRPSCAGRDSPSRASSSIGRSPCSARHSSISRGCSSAWTWSGSPRAAAYAAELLEPVARAGADGVGGDADRGRRCPAAPRAARGSRPPRPGGTARARRGRTRRGAARSRSRPRPRRRRRRAPRQGRGSGTRRPPCIRRRAARE